MQHQELVSSAKKYIANEEHCIANKAASKTIAMSQYENRTCAQQFKPPVVFICSLSTQNHTDRLVSTFKSR